MRLGAERTTFAQLRAQRQQYIEHHANAGDCLAREWTARLVGVDDGCRVRQPLTRQVMIGNDHINCKRLRGGDAVNAGNAVIDRDDDLRRLLRCQRHNFRRQSVAKFETVWHDVADLRTHRAQTTQRNRTGRGTVGVVVGNDQDSLALFNGLNEALAYGVNAFERSRRREL